MSDVKDHFDEIASNHDYWKKRNWYYYQNLKKIIREFVPVDKTVLEIGCGTGDILASVEPKYGIGADISPKMVEIAKSRYNGFTNLDFYISGEIPKRKFYFILTIRHKSGIGFWNQKYLPFSVVLKNYNLADTVKAVLLDQKYKIELWKPKQPISFEVYN